MERGSVNCAANRDGDSFWPLWGLLDLTPAGRGHDWMPQLEYK